jgi:DNA-binding beta-propeller fold protein YncE
MNRYITSFVFLLFACVFSTDLFALPVITSISPDAGPTAGGTAVTINGSGFTGASAVTFDGVNGTALVVVNDGEILVTSPVHSPGSPGNANVVVTTGAGSSTGTHVFTYQGDWQLYVPGGSVGTVTAIDANTFTLNSTITPSGSSQPRGIAISPDGLFTYVADASTNLIYVINTATNTVVSTLIMPGINSPNAVAITPDGANLYTTNQSTADMTHFLIPAGTVHTQSISTGGLLPDAIAITPDGTTAYIANSGSGTVTRINLLTDTLTGSAIPVFTTPRALEITPNGQFVYVVHNSTNPVAVISTASNTVVATIVIGAPQVAISIDNTGTFAYVLSANQVNKIQIATNTVVATLSIAPNSVPVALAISPDSQTLFVAANSPAPVVFSVNLTNFTLVAGSIPVGNGNTKSMAVTPDQSPVARFTITPSAGMAGVPEIFDASASVSPTGTIASYMWIFGDGSTVTTTTPIISHTYTVASNYFVTLEVTNTAGTSIAQVFTGQTVTLQGSPLAIISMPFSSVIASPTGLMGTRVTNTFLTQIDSVNTLTFTPNPDPAITGYFILRDGVLVATIPANGPFVFNDHNRCPGVVYTYTVIAFDGMGNESLPVNIVI